MATRIVAFALFCIMSLGCISCVHAQSEGDLLSRFRAQANDLARRQYLLARMSNLSASDQSFARQLLSTLDCELGLYDQAVRDFPFDDRIALRRPLPWVSQALENSAYGIISEVHGAGNVIAANAADAVAKLAIKRRIVLVNEAHDDPHTRVLILALLPRLRALGYNYFAAEALTERGSALMERGYPIESSGTEYLREPLYGDILREAIRLGYTIVAYDPTSQVPDRDDAQAENLDREVFARDPHARLFVMAGYAHIDKAKGHLGGIEPMAMRLRKLTGLEPLSIDQTQFRDVEPSLHAGPYHQIIDVLDMDKPFVLQLLGGNRIWSSDPGRYDISVVLPPMRGQPRPDWLSLGGERQPWPVDTRLCHDVTPCVVEAHYRNESDDAIPADRYTFLHSSAANSELFLRPGVYRLRAWDAAGKTLGETIIRIVKR
jgi:hypothetical protein